MTAENKVILKKELADSFLIEGINDKLMLMNEAYNTRKKNHYLLDANVYDKYNAVDLVFEKINEILNEHNINLDEIIV